MKNPGRKAIFYIIIAVLLTASASVLWGINRKKAKNADIQKNVMPEEKYKFSAGSVTYGSDYIFYISNKDSLLHYYDIGSNSDVVFCNKPECLHDNRECTAYDMAQLILGTHCHVIIRGDRIYFLGNGEYVDDKNYLNRYLYSCDKNGQNRMIEETYEYIMEIDKEYYIDNYLFLTYTKKEELIEETSKDGSVIKTIGEERNPYETGIVMTNIKTGTSKEIFRKDDMYYLGISQILLVNENLYFLMEYFDVDYFGLYEIGDWENYAKHYNRVLMKVNIENMETEKKYDLSQLNPLGLFGEYFYYIQSGGETAETIWQENLLTGEKKRAIDSVSDCVSNGEKMLWWKTDESGNIIFFLQDMKNGEIIKTQKAEKTGIKAATAYVGDTVFFLYEDGPDGETHRSWMKEKDFLDGNFDAMNECLQNE